MSTAAYGAHVRAFVCSSLSLACLILAGCAGTPAPSTSPRAAANPAATPPRALPTTPEAAPHFDLPSPAQISPAQRPSSGSFGRPLSSLPGWDAEDHAAALSAFQNGCGVARDPRWREACRRARTITPVTETSARAFFENSFSLEPPSPPGLLTAYFAPHYPAQDAPDEVFSAPVRPKPSIRSGDSDERGPTRLEIETGDDVGSPTARFHAFMKPEDLFFLQIQGSGTLTFPDGRCLRALYAADNGRPFTPIARVMVAAGLLAPNQASGDAIRAWLAAHRGPEADAVMDKNARYIFFDLIPDDGREPAGAAGQPLTAGRALAVDPAFHGYGALYWIDASAPTLAGAARTYRRLALALDTGAAIKGERRADLYLGRGDAAGQEAGRVRHVLSLVRLIPITAPLYTPDPLHEAPPETGGKAALVGGHGHR